MKVFRNLELKKFVLIYMVFTVLAVLAGTLCFGVPEGVYVFVMSLGAMGMFLVFTAKRYDAIADLTYQLDRILHGEERINFAPDKEGELAVLSHEIYKMTVRLQEQADLLQKEKSYLSSSIADISHQIKTPLTSVRLILSRLRKETISEEHRRLYVQETLSLLSRIEWLIATLLKIVKLESGTIALEQKSIMVKTLVEKAWEPLEILAEIKEISLDMDISPEISFIGDMSWSVEAVGNILKNCMEHTEESGSLKVEAGENPLYTEIVITDTGTGIGEEELPHLFERFYKGKYASAEGVGIGLNLSHMIIRMQNGTIKAGNVHPHGAVFVIRFYKGAV